MFFIFRTFLYDILREKNSYKYSTTKAVALAATLHLFIGFIVGLIIMYKRQEVDHILIGEMSGLVLVLLGFKNFKSNTPIDPEKLEPKTVSNKSTKLTTSDTQAEGVF